MTHPHPKFRQDELQEFLDDLARLEARYGVYLDGDALQVSTADGEYGGRRVEQHPSGEMTLHAYTDGNIVNSANQLSSKPLTDHERMAMAWAIRRRYGVGEAEAMIRAAQAVGNVVLPLDDD